MGFFQNLFGKRKIVPIASQEEGPPSDGPYKVLPRVWIDFEHQLHKNEVGKPYFRLSPRELPMGKRPIEVPICEDVVMRFILDLGTSNYFINQSFFDDNPSFTLEMLQEMAKNSLLESIDSKFNHVKPSDTAFMMAMGGNCEASLIFLDEFWSEMEILVGEDILFVIPSSDVLILWGRSNVGDTAKIKTTIPQYFADENNPRLLSRGIYLKKLGQNKIELSEWVA